VTIEFKASWVAVGRGSLDLVHSTSPPATHRDREHSAIFIEEFRRRYPAPGRPPENLVDKAMDAINGAPGGRITTRVVRHHITDQEERLSLSRTDDAPAPADLLDAFLANLEQRRGAYNWTGVLDGPFAKWIAEPDPLATALADDVDLNCWQAVLAAAVEARLVPVERVAALYRPTPRSATTVLEHNGVTGTIRHGAGADHANAVGRGQALVMYQGPKAKAMGLHHVMAVAAACPADYRKIEVYSLLGNVGGGVLRKMPLGDLLFSGEWEIEHMSL
jgi:hypothetical protein